MSKTIRELQPHWIAVRSYPSIDDYDRSVEQMNTLVNIIDTGQQPAAKAAGC